MGFLSLLCTHIDRSMGPLNEVQEPHLCMRPTLASLLANTRISTLTAVGINLSRVEETIQKANVTKA